MDDVSAPLKAFLNYIDGKLPEDALMQEIDAEVYTIKNCDEWRREYMTLALEMDRKYAEGKTESKIEDVKKLMETMSLTAEQAMKALKIPDTEFAKYMSLL